ncbi:hypothetical protein PGB90_004260 [Kerria lacca]
MNTVTVITFAVLLSIIDIVHIGCRPTYIQNNSTNKIQACGTDLADILQATCLFGYNSYYQGDEYEKSSNESRKKRGITRECCFQPCTHEELSEYCYDGSSVNVTDPRQKWPELFAEDPDSITITSKINNIDEPLPNENTDLELSNNEVFIRSHKTNSKPKSSIFIPFNSRILSTPSSTMTDNITIKKTRPYYTKPPVIVVIERKFDWKG